MLWGPVCEHDNGGAHTCGVMPVMEMQEFLGRHVLRRLVPPLPSLRADIRQAELSGHKLASFPDFARTVQSMNSSL